jgi:microcystin-dependent protein
MRFHIVFVAAAAALVTGLTATASAAQGPAPGTPYVGEVRAFAFNYCPQGWLPADGRPMAVAQNQGLFSLLGTSFGGNGFSVFNLPDLRGRAPVGTGSGVTMGQQGSAQPGPQPAFLGMTWCIAVQGAFPQNGLGRHRLR